MIMVIGVTAAMRIHILIFLLASFPALIEKICMHQ